jgi:hypothetical protein
VVNFSYKKKQTFSCSIVIKGFLFHPVLLQ